MSKEFDEFMSSMSEIPTNSNDDVKGGESETFKNDIREDDVDKIAREQILYNDSKRAWWKEGYLYAKKNTYTEEDIIDAIGMARNEPDMSWKDIIQSLKQHK